MKTLFAILTIITFASSAFAGIKEGGGDDAIAFVCTSSPQVDARMVVVGTLRGDSQVVDLRVAVGGYPMVYEEGMLGSGVHKYFGQAFEIEFASPVSKITAKKENPVLSVGSSESLECDVRLL